MNSETIDVDEVVLLAPTHETHASSQGKTSSMMRSSAFQLLSPPWMAPRCFGMRTLGGMKDGNGESPGIPWDGCRGVTGRGAPWPICLSGIPNLLLV